MKTWMKVLLILAGYLAALIGAFLACWINDHFLLPPDVRDTGMAAGGDMFLFTGVSVFLSFFPTSLALVFLRKNALFWSLFSKACLAFALGGFLLLVLDMTFHITQRRDLGGLAVMVMFLGMLRLFGTPILALGDGAFALIAPDPKVRRILLLAAGLEAFCACVTYGSLLAGHHFP